MRYPDGPVARSAVLNVRFTPAAKKMVVAVARARGVSPSTWIRYVVSMELERMGHDVPKIGGKGV